PARDDVYAGIVPRGGDTRGFSLDSVEATRSGRVHARLGSVRAAFASIIKRSEHATIGGYGSGFDRGDAVRSGRSDRSACGGNGFLAAEGFQGSGSLRERADAARRQGRADGAGRPAVRDRGGQ